MPANISSYVGRKPAWHGLGTVTDGRYMTWAEIEKAANLDFTVFKSQLRDGLGREVPVWGTFAWDRKDLQLAQEAKSRMDASGEIDAKSRARFLGAVGENYKVIPHGNGFQMIDLLIGESIADGAHYETAGSLRDGAVVWGLADLGIRAKVLGADELKPYLLFATSHDGSYSYFLKTCLERVVCENTLQVAVSEKTSAMFRVRHTKNGMERIKAAHEALTSWGNDVRNVETKLNFLADRRVTRESLETIMKRLFPIKPKETEAGETVEESSTRRDNIIAEILALYESNDNNAFSEIRGTAYNLLNAVTEYTDHIRLNDSGKRAESAMFGSGDKLKTSAYDIIMNVAEKDMPQVQRAVTVDFADLGLQVR